MIQHHEYQTVHADHDLVKSMVQNLHCISFSSAKSIFEALKERAENKNQSRYNVEPIAIAEVMQLLPELPSSPENGDYRYRATAEEIEAAWAIVDKSAKRTIAKISAA